MSNNLVMEHKAHIVEKFETILKENHKSKTLSLYSDVQIPVNHAPRPQEVIEIVSSQMKAIQMADRIVNTKNSKKHTKPKILTQDKLTAYDKIHLKKKPVNTFETQCVSDTQLIDVVRVAEAFDAEGSQDLNTSFSVSDLEKVNKDITSKDRNADINDNPKETNIRSNSICKDKTKDHVITKETDNNNDNIDCIETDVIGLTDDYIVCNNYEHKAINDRKDETVATNEFDSINNIAGVPTTFIGFTEDLVESDKDIFKESEYEYLGDDFDAIEKGRCISLSPILNKIGPIKTVDENSSLHERNKDKSVSPLFSVKKGKTSSSPLPLVFNLDYFERFEEVAIPLIEENLDLETAKHLINSQILDKELFLPSKTTIETTINYEQIKCSDTEPYISRNNDKNYEAKTSLTELKSKDDKDKYSSTLEDEILFSSDEEDYEHKEIQDLPLTCALETSFYDQSDILDKTMYVGFQTANNKSIQVCTESFTKAKSMLKEIHPSDKNILTLTELVNNWESVSKNGNEPVKEKSPYPEKLDSKVDELIVIPDVNVSMLNKLTGDPKKVHVDNKSTVITNLKEINMNQNTQFPDINMSVLNTVICNVSQENNDNTNQKVNENVPEFVQNMESLKNNKFEDFRTASYKMINLSDAALARCQKVFQGIDLDEKYNQKDTCIKNRESKIIPEYHIDDRTHEINSNNNDRNDMITDINDDIILQEFENIEMSVRHEDKEEIPLVGFKTASHKNIKISKKAEEKAQHLFEDIKISSDNSPYLTANLPFKLTSDKHKEISKVDYDSEIKNTIPKFGFKTASNKNINISDRAIDKTKNLFQDINLDLVNKSDAMIVMDFEHFAKPSTSTGFAGFLTASNKQIRVSDEAISTTKFFFKDIDISYNIPTSKTAGFETTNDKVVHVSSKALEESKKMFIEKNPNIGRRLYSDTPRNSQSAPNQVKFQTASNEQVHISSKALERGRQIFQDEIPESINKIDVCVPKTLKSVPNITFQTANNKPVHIPKKAFERTKKIFQNLDAQGIGYKLDNELKTNLPFVFKTVNNKDVMILEQASAQTKEVSNNLCTISDENKPLDGSGVNAIIEQPCKGFQTASKKDVKVSKEALDKCKTIFQDIDFSNEFNVQNVGSSIAKDSKIVNLKMESACGFKTANYKPVSVSADALARSKRLFDDIDDIYDTNITKNINNARNIRYTKEIYPIESNTSDYKVLVDNVKYSKENVNFGGFKTASNRKVNISEQALAKSKQIFQDIDVLDVNNQKTDLNINKTEDDIDYKKLTKKIKCDDLYDSARGTTLNTVTLDDINKENIADIINTQLLNNFEDTLYTEDFRQEVSISNKRSGSPILSCPRAKKRRFETPYKANRMEEDNTTIKDFVKLKENSIFTENYKNNKIYKLKDLDLRDEKGPIDPYLSNFDFETLLNLKFEGKRNDLTENKIDIETLKDMFLNSVNKKLVPNGWLENHIKLILWKLISYEVRFSGRLGTVSARNLINQLKYRYERELYNAERPALRKIFEKDDVPSKTIVLCVVAILVDGIKVDSVTTIDMNVELLLTDGWYCVMTCIDKMLTQLVTEKKIVVGSKIVTHGAELLNCGQGVAPWEDTSSIRLKIFGNSTRRARWDARLGYHGNSAILSQLSNVKPDGGKVSKLRLYVTRVYPALYVEKFEDGSTVTRSERLEHIHQAKYEADRQNLMEKLYEEVEKEFSDLDSQDSDSTLKANNTCLQSGSQIFEAVRKSKDPSDLRNQLTSSQAKLLEAHTTKRREQLLEKVQARLTEKIDSNGLRQGRNVVTVLKARVVGVKGTDVTKGLLSVWKPNDSILDLIKEDSWIEVMNVVPTAIRYSEIQISAGRQSVFIQSKYKEHERIKNLASTLCRKCYNIKELINQNSTIYNEIDTAGIIFLIEPSLKDFDLKSQFQNVYVADKERNIICVIFWGGLQKFGFQSVLDTGQVVACINLQKRAGNTRNILQYRATEFTYFTKTPKNSQAKEIVDELNKMSVLDRRKFCEECVKIKNNFSVNNNDNVTPYRMNMDLHKNKAFLDSVEKITHSEFNLTGLDFESSFRQEDQLSPKTLKRKREVNNRINKLKMYGEPPPLSPIHIINKSKNALSSYKSPLVNNDISPSAARGKNTDIGRNVENKTTPMILRQEYTNVASRTARNIENKDSPVTSLNKTYIKNSVNPVKLNFDKDTSDLVDHFAEEFDPSPPLSLD